MELPKFEITKIEKLDDPAGIEKTWPL